MIHLDTNYLIGLLVRGSSEAQKVDQWLAANQSIAASSIAWSESLNGPVTIAEATQVETVLQSQSFPLEKQKHCWRPTCSIKPDGNAAPVLTA